MEDRHTHNNQIRIHNIGIEVPWWSSMAEGRSTPGAPVTALPWGNDLVLFISDPNGGIYTTLWNPQTKVGYWESVAEGNRPYRYAAGTDSWRIASVGNVTRHRHILI